MRHRPINYKKDNPEIFKKLVKNNHYIAKVYNYPNILDPHPTYEKFRKIKAKKYGITKNKSSSIKTHLEIGCGSGRYLIEWANNNKQDSFIGFELRYKRLALAAKKIEQKNIKNIILMRECGEFFDEYFQRNTLDYLHINFPDPWIKKSHLKNRILNYDFLIKLSSIMSFNGEFRFKTDHLEYFKSVFKIITEIKKFHITEFTEDLHNSIFNKDNILTEFEMLFKSKKNPSIYYLLAKKK
tara:strand:+ start:820 stop:1539 length:720 start_codon:yes stop_codon:yes gene_type:complete